MKIRSAAQSVLAVVIVLSYFVACGQSEDWAGTSPHDEASLLPTPGTEPPPPPPCQEDAARALAHAYFLTNPFAEEPLDEFLVANAALFGPDGAAIRCARHAGPVLLSAAFRSWDQNAYDRATDIAGRVGRPDLASGLAQEINNGSLDLMQMGQDTSWLADALPPILEGDWFAYENGGSQSRQALRQMMPLIASICSTDPEACRVAVAAFAVARPHIEEYMYILLMMTNTAA